MAILYIGVVDFSTMRLMPERTLGETMLIPTLVPSRNRASQLFTLLESVQTNCPDTFDFTVLVKWDDPRYLAGYDQLSTMIFNHDGPYPADQIRFVVEDDCCKDFYGWLNSVDSNYMSLFVDDCIFYRPLHPKGPEELTDILDEHDDTWLLTLREGLNSTIHSYVPWDYRVQAPVEVKEEILDGKYIKWDASCGDPHYNQFFMWGWDGIIFRAEEYKEILNNVQFDDLRMVEHNMNNGENRKIVLANHTCKISPKLSCVFSAQWSCVHKVKGYAGGVVSCSPEEFNRRFLNNETIDWQGMDLLDIIKSCHFEPSIKWKQI